MSSRSSYMQDLQQRFQMMKRQEAAAAAAAGPGEFPTTKSTSILSYPKLGEKQVLPCSAFGIIDHNQNEPPPHQKKTKEQKNLRCRVRGGLLHSQLLS
jgi:hypothetical protein